MHVPQQSLGSSLHTQYTRLAVQQLRSPALNIPPLVIACVASNNSTSSSSSKTTKIHSCRSRSSMPQSAASLIARRALQQSLPAAAVTSALYSRSSSSSRIAAPGWYACLYAGSSSTRHHITSRRWICDAAESSATGSNSSRSSSSNGGTAATPGGSSSKRASQAAGGAWVVNKEPISTAMSPQLYSYLLAHTREPAVLAELRSETAGMHGGHMQIAPEQGQLLSLLVELLGVRSAIEVGVFTGYSSLAVALALPAHGRLVAFDRDPVSMEVARRYWEKAGVSAKVDSRLGPGLKGLQQLLQDEGENTFDFAFIDADKRGYQAYFDLCLRLVRPGGLIAVDNVLFYGKVADAAASDKATMALKQFNDDLMADERVSFCIVPIGDGMALCRKR